MRRQSCSKARTVQMELSPLAATGQARSSCTLQRMAVHSTLQFTRDTGSLYAHLILFGAQATPVALLRRTRSVKTMLHRPRPGPSSDCSILPTSCCIAGAAQPLI
jgi:hypothetical protein